MKTAADTFRPNPALDVARVLTELGVGEALVSMLDQRGTPGIVERALVYPPRTQLAPLPPAEREALVRRSALYGHYEQTVDRESAYERLNQRAAAAPPPAGPVARGNEPDLGKIAISVGTSVARAMGTQLGRSIIRGVFGSFFGGRRR